MGATGQLGREICKQLGPAALPLLREQVDLRRPEEFLRVLERERPQSLINCAGWTAVDDAERFPTECLAINATAIQELVAACNSLDIHLVQVSTDYVFGADSNRTVPYEEVDVPGPINTYGESKLAGEVAAAKANKHLIVRTCGLYTAGKQGPVRGRNFADTMLVLGEGTNILRVVSDQVCTPSFVPHVAKGILDLLSLQKIGLFHIVNSGATTWHNFASELLHRARLKTVVHAITSNEYPTLANRPKYSVLSSNKFSTAVEYSLPNWQDGIREYIKASTLSHTDLA